MPSIHLEQLYQRAQKLSNAERNYDYAHELLAQCVIHAPSREDYAVAMLANLRAKYSGAPKKSAGLFWQGANRVLKKALQNEDWSGCFQKGAALLKANPWDVATLRALAMACEARHCNEAELVYLKQALDANPKDVEINRHCARSLGRMGQFDQAIACWHRIETLRGKDAEAARMISQLAEEKLKYPGGIPPAPAAHAPVKAVVADQSRAATPSVEPSLTPRQLLECAVGRNPQDERSHLRLADELIASAAYEEAERRLQQALVACDGSQPQLLIEKLEQVHMLLAKQPQAQEEASLHANEQSAEMEFRTPWLKLLLGAAMLALLVQVFPVLGTTLRQALDFRNWGRGTWFVANLLVLLFLCCLRFVPELIRSLRKNHARS